MTTVPVENVAYMPYVLNSNGQKYALAAVAEGQGSANWSGLSASLTALPVAINLTGTSACPEKTAGCRGTNDIQRRYVLKN